MEGVSIEEEINELNNTLSMNERKRWLGKIQV